MLMNNKNKKKMLAPILITIFLIAYYAFYFGFLCAIFSESVLALTIFGIAPVALSIGMIYVCVQRIKEIRSGEEDDISKY